MLLKFRKMVDRLLAKPKSIALNTISTRGMIFEPQYNFITTLPILVIYCKWQVLLQKYFVTGIAVRARLYCVLGALLYYES
jgi:hypothetical protein